MHIAVVCRGLGTAGGVSAVALRQARELARHARVTLISDTLPADTPFAARVLAPVPDLDVLRRFRHVVDEVTFTRAARRALFTLGDVDFVLCHGHAAAALVAKPFRAKRNVPFAMVVHGDISDRPKGTYDARLTAFYRWVTPRAYASADLVIVLTPYFIDIARRGGAERIEVVPNGVDPDDIGGAGEHRPREGALRLLFVGRLAIEKGIDVLLEACAKLDTDYTLDYTLDIVGKGPLESHVPQTDRIHLLGTRPRHELGAIYAAHDVFCMPSLSEPFALVILEALACGTPVIGTRVGGIPDVVVDGVNGLLVPPKDADAFASAITKLANDEPLRAQLAARAKESVLPRLSWTNIGDRLVQVIRDVANRSANP